MISDPSLAGLVEQLWQRFRPLVRSRLDAVEAHLSGQPVGPPLAEANRAAHALAGALGTYGRPAGNELARELERALNEPDRSGAARAALRRLEQVLDV